jgi:hypothetical protein
MGLSYQDLRCKDTYFLHNYKIYHFMLIYLQIPSTRVYPEEQGSINEEDLLAVIFLVALYDANLPAIHPCG